MSDDLIVTEKLNRVERYKITQLIWRRHVALARIDYVLDIFDLLVYRLQSRLHDSSCNSLRYALNIVFARKCLDRALHSNNSAAYLFESG
jgi:hypothetical protein